MLKLVGKILESMSKVAPGLVMKAQVAIVDNMVSKYTDSAHGIHIVMSKVNEFLRTMPKEKRVIVMEKAGISTLPSWVTREGVVHMGDRDE